MYGKLYTLFNIEETRAVDISSKLLAKIVSERSCCNNSFNIRQEYLIKKVLMVPWIGELSMVEARYIYYFAGQIAEAGKEDRFFLMMQILLGPAVIHAHIIPEAVLYGMLKMSLNLHIQKFDEFLMHDKQAREN